MAAAYVRGARRASAPPMTTRPMTMNSSGQPSSPSESHLEVFCSSPTITSAAPGTSGHQLERLPAAQGVERVDGEKPDAQAERHRVPVELEVGEHEPHAQAGEHPGGHEQAVVAAERPPGEEAEADPQGGAARGDHVAEPPAEQDGADHDQHGTERHGGVVAALLDGLRVDGHREGDRPAGRARGRPRRRSRRLARPPARRSPPRPRPPGPRRHPWSLSLSGMRLSVAQGRRQAALPASVTRSVSPRGCRSAPPAAPAGWRR